MRSIGYVSIFLISISLLSLPQVSEAQTASEVNIVGQTVDNPYDITLLDANTLLIADRDNFRILQVALDTGLASEFPVTGPIGAFRPEAVTVSTTHLFIGNNLGSNVIKVPLAGGDAAELTLTGLPFTQSVVPTDLVIVGTELFIASGNRVVRTTENGGAASEMSITGLANNSLNGAFGLAISGNDMYVADFHNDRIIILPLAGGNAVELNITGLTNNTLNGPWGIGFAGGPDPELFIADAINGRVIMVPLNGGDASDLNFTGLLADPILGEPRGLVITEAALFITDGAKNRIIRTTGPDENDGIDVVVTSTLGDIGDTVTVELKLDNQDSTYVGGFQASVKVQDLSRARILEVENTNQVPDFTVSFVQTDSVAHFIIFSASGDSIAPNPADSLSCFATIKILIQGPTEGGAATRGDFVDLDVFNVQVGNPQGEPLNAGDHDGRVFIGIECDTNFDVQINILDIISLIRNIVNNTLPDGNTTGFVVSNGADSDDDLNVADAIAIVNKILGILQQSFGKQVPTGPVAINLSEPMYVSHRSASNSSPS